MLMIFALTIAIIIPFINGEPTATATADPDAEAKVSHSPDLSVLLGGSSKDKVTKSKV